MMHNRNYIMQTRYASIARRNWIVIFAYDIFFGPIFWYAEKHMIDDDGRSPLSSQHTTDKNKWIWDFILYASKLYYLNVFNLARNRVRRTCLVWRTECLRINETEIRTNHWNRAAKGRLLPVNIYFWFRDFHKNRKIAHTKNETKAFSSVPQKLILSQMTCDSFN